MPRTVRIRSTVQSIPSHTFLKPTTIPLISAQALSARSARGLMTEEAWVSFRTPSTGLTYSAPASLFPSATNSASVALTSRSNSLTGSVPSNVSTVPSICHTPFAVWLALILFLAALLFLFLFVFLFFFAHRFLLVILFLPGIL